MKKEFAIVLAVDELRGWRATQRKAAQGEWTGVEGEFLATCRALLADEADRLDFFESSFGNPEPWKDFADLCGRGTI